VRITAVFNMLLCMQGAFVGHVGFRPFGVPVSAAKRHFGNRCPRSSFSAWARHDRTVREWRHVSLGKSRVMLRATPCHPDCPERDVASETIPWAEHEMRFARDFEDLPARAARDLTQTALKGLLHAAFARARSIIERVPARKLGLGRPERLCQLGRGAASKCSCDTLLTAPESPPPRRTATYRRLPASRSV